ncbi:MAG: helix-turn-helix domain-containing protein [Burkholderiales bacterium]
MSERSDAGESVGEELARARAALGLSVADVVQHLKFSPRQIEALEQGRYELLPTGTFARGMLRAYARLLRLDPAPLIQRIAERVAVPDNAATVASARRPIPITDSNHRGNLIYAALSLAILGAIAGVVFEWQRERSGSARLVFVPAAAQAPLLSTQAPLESGQAPASTERTAVASTVAAPGLSPLPQAEPADAGSSSGTGDTKRIVMKFERSSWVEIRGHDGKPLISQLNPGGTEQAVEGKPPFALVIGNAQYVRLSYGDRPIDLAPHVKVEVARFTLD